MNIDLSFLLKKGDHTETLKIKKESVKKQYNSKVAMWLVPFSIFFFFLFL